MPPKMGDEDDKTKNKQQYIIVFNSYPSDRRCAQGCSLGGTYSGGFLNN